MEEKSKQCSHCKQIVPLSGFFRNGLSKDGLQYKCKSCESAYAKAYNRKTKQPNPPKMRKLKKWNKLNKNHYPDPEWVWQQIENGNTGSKLYDKLDQKYALKSHGNLGKKHDKLPK